MTRKLIYKCDYCKDEYDGQKIRIVLDVGRPSKLDFCRYNCLSEWLKGNRRAYKRHES